MGGRKTAKSGRKNVTLYYSLLLYINNINIIYNNNVTACYCAWIVACHVCLSIFPLFDLHFCKVCLHFIYIPFHLLFCLLFCLAGFRRAICVMGGKSLILNSFFLPKRLPKLAGITTRMASP